MSINRRQFLKASLASLVGAGLTSLTGCNPIDTCKTLTIRHKEPQLYETYKKITNNYSYDKLTSDEKKYLAEMHQEYGKGPIRSEKLQDRMSKKFVDNFVALTGHKKFTDPDLIFIQRTSPSLLGAILLHGSGN